MKRFYHLIYGLILIILLLPLISPASENMADTTQRSLTLSEKINEVFTPVVDQISKVLFWDPFAAIGIYDPVVRDDSGTPVLDKQGNIKRIRVPLVVVWLICGALFFTFYMGFVNIRRFWLAIRITKGDFANKLHPGEVSHFQALATALSATVGMGNIAGVAIAISIGGPGATFWMVLAGLLGMSSKFVECTLGVKYRKVDEKGVVSGGPMYYLSKGLEKRGMKNFGKILAIIFAIMVIGGSIGGGNMFQVNQTFSQLTYLLPQLSGYGAEFGIFMAFLVGIVVIGGIKSIARVTDKLVPFMAILYVTASLVIIFANITRVHEAFSLIFWGAFSASAIKGGFVGVMITGFQRAAFSNEAGVGSAAIAHSAVKTQEPITEGLVSLLEPFIDTVIICTMTALVLVFTGFYNNPSELQGSQLTSAAFESVIPWFPYVLLIAIFLFAYSTMISWSYYGLKGFDFLFGRFFEKVTGNRKWAEKTYHILFLICIVIGAASSMGAVMDFSDMMILSCAFPNLIGLFIMSKEVKLDLKTFLAKVKSGEISKHK